MPLDTGKIEQLIERAEDVRGMTFGLSNEAVPLSENDKLEDLPAELRPPADKLAQVRSVIGYLMPDSVSWNGLTSYKLIKVGEKVDFNHRLYDGRLTAIHSNYRELVAKLLHENAVKNPACHRVFLDTRHESLIVHVSNIHTYGGNDSELARGLLFSLKKLRVTDESVHRDFSQYHSLIRDLGCDRFAYDPRKDDDKSEYEQLEARRIKKGQLPFVMVRDVFWAMRHAMNKTMRASGFYIENHPINDRTFCEYADRIYRSYRMFRYLTNKKGRRTFRADLEKIKPYIPGMLTSKVEGRAAFAKWVQKTLRKER